MLVRTIALDFTNLQTLNANIKFFKVLKLGLILETTLKFDFEKENVSAFCNRKKLKCEDILFKLVFSSLLESIILKFLFLFNIFKAQLHVFSRFFQLLQV